MFTATEFFPGVFHIADCMGVCMTLLRGSRKALLIDTGYGVENVKEYAEALAGGEVSVLLTHGHHDHALGAAYFDSTLMFKEDADVFEKYTGAQQRARVAGQAKAKGIETSPDFESMTAPMPLPLVGEADPETGFECVRMDLGGVTAVVYRVPGHTEGSAVVYVPEYSLLLSGDDWNMCTWCWFPEARSVKTLRGNMRLLIAALPFENVLCSHRAELYSRSDIIRFFDALTDENLAAAPRYSERVPEFARRLVISENMEIVFNSEKL